MAKTNLTLLLFRKLSLFFPIIITVFGINYWADSNLPSSNPAKNEAIAKVIADSLLKNNKEALNAYEPALIGDHKTIAKYYINELSNPINIIILGSSRSRQIRSSDLSIKSDKTFFNNSMSGARLKEFVSVYDMFRIKKIIPRVVILEISPWILTNKKTVYSDFLSKIKFKDSEKVFSFIFFQRYLQKLTNSEWGRGRNFAINELDSFCGLNLNNERIAQFESFISLMQNDQVRIIFLLAPIHPYLYRIISTPEYEIVFKIQEYFISFAYKNNIEIVGSYNPAACGCDATDFDDNIHPRETSTKKIFKNIKF